MTPARPPPCPLSAPSHRPLSLRPPCARPASSLRPPYLYLPRALPAASAPSAPCRHADLVLILTLTPTPTPTLPRRADLVLTLGTSLRIEPAGSLPQLAAKFCIVNLQKTPKDSAAALIVRAPVDVVMETIMREVMGLRLRCDGRGGGAEWVACDKEPS